MQKDCVFCKIVAGELETHKEYETETLIVFKDIHPSAPIHLLIVPKIHLKDITEVSDELWLEMKKVAQELAKRQGLIGFRIATNAGDTALIDHMHMHFLAGIKKDRKV